MSRQPLSSPCGNGMWDLVLEGPARSSNYRDSSRLTHEGAEARGGGWLEQGHTARRGTQTSDSRVRVCSCGAVVLTIGQGSSSELEKAQEKQSPSEHHQRRLQGSTSSSRVSVSQVRKWRWWEGKWCAWDNTHSVPAEAVPRPDKIVRS